MNNVEFALHFAEHVEVGLLYAILCLLVNLTLMRRYIYSLFDPLLFYAVLSAMGGAVVLYLQHFGLIRPFYFWSYLATQVAFTAGFLLIPPPSAVRSPKPSMPATYSGPIKILYPLAVVLFVVLQLYAYSVTGLPIFLESRLEAFSTGGGFGFVNRVIFVVSNITLVCAFYRLMLLRRGRLSRTLDYAVVAFCIAVAVVSGSKGALLSLVFSVSLALFFARRFHGVQRAEGSIRRFFVLLIGLAFPVAFGTIYLQAGIDNPIELVSVVAMRFFQTGEIYFMVYPNDVLQHLPDGNGVLALFYSPLGSLRLVPREYLPVNLGLQAFWYHYDSSLLAGPNARHNVFGLHYFGPYISVLFSLLLGLSFSIARNSSYRLLPSTPVGMNVYVLLVSCAVFIEQDVAGQALDYLFSLVLVFPPLYALSYFIRPAARRRARRIVLQRLATEPGSKAAGPPRPVA